MSQYEDDADCLGDECDMCGEMMLHCICDAPMPCPAYAASLTDDLVCPHCGQTRSTPTKLPSVRAWPNNRSVDMMKHNPAASHDLGAYIWAADDRASISDTTYMSFFKDVCVDLPTCYHGYDQTEREYVRYCLDTEQTL